MRKFFFAAAMAATLAGTASLALAQATQWKFDPSHSEATFAIRHWLTTVNGRFNTMTGTISFDEKDWSKSTVEANIETASIFTNNERRDGHLKSPDFFDAATNPAITFKSSKVTKGTGNDFTIDGDLTMHGVTKKVTLAATYLGTMDIGQGRQKAGWTAKTKVNRKDYNLTWNRTLDNGQVMLGDDVDIVLNIEADKAAEGATATGGPTGTPPAAPTKK